MSSISTHSTDNPERKRRELAAVQEHCETPTHNCRSLQLGGELLAEVRLVDREEVVGRIGRAITACSASTSPVSLSRAGSMSHRMRA